MILADENIHSFIIKTLRENGFTVLSVSELNKGKKDEEIIQWALEKKHTVLTEDKDFGEWVFCAPHKQFKCYLFKILLR